MKINEKKGNLFQIADILYDNAINYPIDDGIFNYICCYMYICFNM